MDLTEAHSSSDTTLLSWLSLVRSSHLFGHHPTFLAIPCPKFTPLHTSSETTLPSPQIPTNFFAFKTAEAPTNSMGTVLLVFFYFDHDHKNRPHGLALSRHALRDFHKPPMIGNPGYPKS
jgi:hypothetical protein